MIHFPKSCMVHLMSLIACTVRHVIRLYHFYLFKFNVQTVFSVYLCVPINTGSKWTYILIRSLCHFHKLFYQYSVACVIACILTTLNLTNAFPFFNSTMFNHYHFQLWRGVWSWFKSKLHTGQILAWNLCWLINTQL